MWQPVVAQMFWTLGKQIQTILLDAIRDKVKPPTGWTVSTAGFEHCLEQAWILDRRLVQYVQNCHKKAQHQQFFSFAVDKSDVGGLGAGLQVTTSLWRDNVCGLLIPQVPHACKNEGPFWVVV